MSDGQVIVSFLLMMILIGAACLISMLISSGKLKPKEIQSEEEVKNLLEMNSALSDLLTQTRIKLAEKNQELNEANRRLELYEKGLPEYIYRPDDLR